MIIIAINLTLVAFIALPLGAITLGVTVYFFMKTRESLRETMKANKPRSFIQQQKEAPQKRTSLLADLEGRFAQLRQKATEVKEEIMPAKKTLPEEKNIVHDLKSTIAQQQKVLTSYLQQVEELENGGKEELRQQNKTLEKEVDRLHSIIEQKDLEIEDIHQQAAAEQKMATKIEEVYQEFEQFQAKMGQLEKQANRSNNLAIELEDARHSYEQVHKELLRKQEKLEDVMNDNQRMREEMNELEDKLSDANLQRQQLQKKVQFLQDLNTDMQSISDTNKKLQTELRRIGELESMLNMMAAERDSLLRKKSDQ
jgi:chromosome segregation ATPase